MQWVCCEIVRLFCDSGLWYLKLKIWSLIQNKRIFFRGIDILTADVNLTLISSTETMGDEKYDSKHDDDDSEYNCKKTTPPKIEIISINFEPAVGSLSGPLELSIKFELDRDVVAGYWIVRFLVDSCDRRLIKVSWYALRLLWSKVDITILSNIGSYTY